MTNKHDTKQLYDSNNSDNWVYHSTFNTLNGFLESAYHATVNLAQISSETISGITAAASYTYNNPSATYDHVIKSSYELASIAVRKMPNAAYEAVILDGSVALVIGGALMYTPLAPASSFSVFAWHLGSTVIGSTIAYDLRGSVNEYFKNSEYAFAINSVVGSIAGGMKYGIKHSYKTILKMPTSYLQEIKYGAVNNYLYENLKPIYSEYIEERDFFKVLGALNFIEGLETTWKLYNGAFLNNEGKPIVTHPIATAILLNIGVTTLLDSQLFTFIVPEENKELLTNMAEANIQFDAVRYLVDKIADNYCYWFPKACETTELEQAQEDLKTDL